MKTLGQLLRDVNFERGCSYGIEPRPDNDVQSFVELEAEEDSSGFSDPEMLNIIAQFERKEEAKRRLTAHIAKLAKVARDEELAKVARDELDKAMRDQEVRKATRSDSSHLSESQALRQNELAPVVEPLSASTNLALFFGNDNIHAESVISRLFGPK